MRHAAYYFVPAVIGAVLMLWTVFGGVALLPKEWWVAPTLATLGIAEFGGGLLLGTWLVSRKP